jgi:hypothetical protein
LLTLSSGREVIQSVSIDKPSLFNLAAAESI